MTLWQLPACQGTVGWPEHMFSPSLQCWDLVVSAKGWGAKKERSRVEKPCGLQRFHLSLSLYVSQHPASHRILRALGKHGGLSVG